MRSVREVLEGVETAVTPDGATPFHGLKQEIRLNKVVFHHDDRAAPILDGADLTIPRGEITALAGPSESGKTMIVTLLMWLHEPDPGRILIDDTPLSQLSRASWLHRVALAGQDVELIEGTIAQNLRLARHDATVDEMRQACAAVEMLTAIDAIPDGFDARIGPQGLNFSGGQRQRLGLARALLHRPDVLILDEALSAVEPALEDRIRHRLRAILPQATILSISHRRDGADWADRVIRLDEGRVMAEPPSPGCARPGRRRRRPRADSAGLRAARAQ